MIQRIQTLYLLFAGIFVFLSLGYSIFGPFDIYGVLYADRLEFVNYIIKVLLGLTGVLSLYDIFLYKNRIKQIKVAGIAMLSTFVAYVIVVIMLFIKTITWDNVATIILMLLPLVSLLMIQYARKAIAKDENLVRAADRIR